MAVDYPLRIFQKEYRGRDARKLAEYRSKIQAAAQIEANVNGLHEANRRMNFSYNEIAHALDMPREIVVELMRPVDFGTSEFTFAKGLGPKVDHPTTGHSDLASS